MLIIEIILPRAQLSIILLLGMATIRCIVVVNCNIVLLDRVIMRLVDARRQAHA